jgi:hypothetical protein
MYKVILIVFLCAGNIVLFAVLGPSFFKIVTMLQGIPDPLQS